MFSSSRRVNLKNECVTSKNIKGQKSDKNYRCGSGFEQRLIKLLIK